MALATNEEDAVTLDDIALEFEQQMGHEPNKSKQMLSFCKHNEYPFGYKHIKKWWAKKEEAIEIRKKYNTEPDYDVWKVGTFVQIYSRSKNKWFPGHIEREIDDEMLVVKYLSNPKKNKKTTKRIQRSNENLKPFPDNHPLLFIVGTQCKIYENGENKWSRGEINKIYTDDEGEWLKIKTSKKLVDIQRFSPDLIANHNVNGDWHDDIKTVESCVPENIVFCLRNHVFNEKEFKTNVFGNYKEKMIGYFYRNNIDGKYIENINMNEFIGGLCEYLGVKESHKKLTNMFKKMVDVLMDKIKQMFVFDDKINGENDEKSESEHDDDDEVPGVNKEEEREEENDDNDENEEENDENDNDEYDNDEEENDEKENES